MTARTLLAALLLLIVGQVCNLPLRLQASGGDQPPERVAPLEGPSLRKTKRQVTNLPHDKKSAEAKRLNVLWLTCEDMSCTLGCYGDKDAKTPNLDAFARTAVRYDNAFSGAGAEARTTGALKST